MRLSESYCCSVTPRGPPAALGTSGHSGHFWALLGTLGTFIMEHMDTCTMDTCIMGTYIMDTCIMDTCIMDGPHGLSTQRAQRTKSTRPKGRRLEVGARRAPKTSSQK